MLIPMPSILYVIVIARYVGLFSFYFSGGVVIALVAFAVIARYVGLFSFYEIFWR